MTASRKYKHLARQLHKMGFVQNATEIPRWKLYKFKLFLLKPIVDFIVIQCYNDISVF